MKSSMCARKMGCERKGRKKKMKRSDGKSEQRERLVSAALTPVQT